MRIKVITLTLVVALSMATASAQSLGDGVSRQLAQHRAQHLSQVSYRLGFTVPDNKTEAVSYVDTVRFVWDGVGDVVLDSQGGTLDSSIIVNGRRRTGTRSDEHITLSTKWLRRGCNEVILRGTSSDGSLNRQQDYMYTLFVPDHARSAFPCFDQPDLKATFHLTLNLPQGWTSVSSDATEHPIPTYLFSFTAGKFHEKTATRSGRRLRALYREEDPAKVAQLKQVFDIIDHSINWLENYTGIAYPFSRYECVMLPGYQFGGMEHPGAIQYRARTIFLGPQATQADELKRFELLAHETAHMWFGDLVTMRWFDDVWTKEVYANFLAAKMSREVFPDVDRQLSFIKSYQLPAITTDRTDGTHPIQQPLDNLNQAGLLYGNIIYDKAPVMMAKLEQLMGEEALRRGLQAYLKKYSYGNATWDGLVHLLDSVAPQADVEKFSDVWVKQKGMPTITVSRLDGNKLQVVQHDPLGRGLVWPQRFNIALADASGQWQLVPCDMRDSVVTIDLTFKPNYVIPSPDGTGYGYFELAQEDLDSLLHNLPNIWTTLPPSQRLAVVATLNENTLHHRLDRQRMVDLLSLLLPQEHDQLVFATAAGYHRDLSLRLPVAQRHAAEQMLYDLATSSDLPAGLKVTAKRLIYLTATAPELIDSIYAVWQRHDDKQLTEQNYTSMAYHLAQQRPEQWQEILAVQRQRLTSDDDRREFDFVSRACNPSPQARMELFQSLNDVENRRVEPWARGLMTLLNAPVNEPHSNQYIQPALDMLPQVQRTGDIFFPGYWISTLVSGHRSPEAKRLVEQWIESNPTLSPPLMNKLKENTWLLRTQQPNHPKSPCTVNVHAVQTVQGVPVNQSITTSNLITRYKPTHSSLLPFD